MQRLEFHPIAGIFPLIEGDEFYTLVSDIKLHGVREPIWLLDGKILDGRNRYNAAKQAGVQFATRNFSGTHLEAIEFVWSLNRTRRHMNSSQAAIADARRNQMTDAYAPVREAAKERQVEAGAHGASGGRPKAKTLQALMPEGFPEKEPVKAQQPQKPVAQPTAQQPAPQTRDVRAKAAGTNAKYIDMADRLIVERPELVAEIEAGKKTLTQVQRDMKEEQREARREENRAKVALTCEPKEIIQAGARFATIMIDPPWDWGDEGDQDQLGRSRPDYATMSIEQLLALPVADLADIDCHIYLWITNRSLPKGFSLLDKWGFRYITAITWAKPSYGLGNYFRGQTEHVLFGVKGSQMLKRKDVGTLFSAPRGRGGHSSKPEEFYALIESCSPGPYIEMFSRSNRDGWKMWGENA